MKKTLFFFVAGLFFSLSPVFVFAATTWWTDTNYPLFSTALFMYSGSGEVTETSDYYAWFRPDGGNTGFVGWSASSNTFSPAASETDGVDPYGNWTLVEFTPGTTACQSGVLSSCEASGGFVTEHAVCVGDPVADCGGGGGGGGGGGTGTTTPFVNCINATSTDCAYKIDNPNQNLANGVYVFILGMFLPMWFFKRKTTL